MFSHAQSLLIQTQKRFLSILVAFGKYFVFTKTENFKKQCCPILATQSWVKQVACHSCELAGQFWRLVREWKVQSWGVHREFHGSARNSLTSRPSSCEKNLENFFIILTMSVLAACPGNSPQSRKMHVWQKVGQFLKTFSVFPRTFYNYSLSLSIETHPNTPYHSLQTPFLHFFTSKSLRKRYGFSFPHLISRVLSFIFVNICVDVLFFVMGLFRFLSCPCLDCWGIVLIRTCFSW